MAEQRWPIGTTFDPIPPPLDVREVYPGQGMFPEQLPPPVLTEPEPSPHYGYAPIISRYQRGPVEGTYRQPSWIGRGLAWLLQPLLRREVLEPEQIQEVPQYDEMPYRLNQRTGEAEPYANVQITPGEYGPVEFRSPGEAMLSGIGRLWAFKEAVKNQMRTPEGREQVSQVAQALPETLSGAAQEYMTKQIDMPRRGEQEMWNPQTGEIEDFTVPLVAAELMMGTRPADALGMAVFAKNSVRLPPRQGEMEITGGNWREGSPQPTVEAIRTQTASWPNVGHTQEQWPLYAKDWGETGGWLARVKAAMMADVAEHTIEAGETASSIANRYNISLDDLKGANPNFGLLPGRQGLDSDVGLTLYIPGVPADEAEAITKQLIKYYQSSLGTADDPIRMGLWEGTILAPFGTPMRTLLDKVKEGRASGDWDTDRAEFERLYDESLGATEWRVSPKGRLEEVAEDVVETAVDPAPSGPTGALADLFRPIVLGMEELTGTGATTPVEQFTTRVELRPDLVPGQDPGKKAALMGKYKEQLKTDDPAGVQRFNDEMEQKLGPEKWAEEGHLYEEETLVPYLMARARVRGEGVEESHINVPTPSPRAYDSGAGSGAPEVVGPRRQLPLSQLKSRYESYPILFPSLGQSTWGAMDWMPDDLLRDIGKVGRPPSMGDAFQSPPRWEAHAGHEKRIADMNYRLPDWDQYLESSPALRAVIERDIPATGFSSGEQPLARGLESPTVLEEGSNLNVLPEWQDDLHILEPVGLGRAIAQLSKDERRGQQGLLSIEELIGRASTKKYLIPPKPIVDDTLANFTKIAEWAYSGKRSPPVWFERGTDEVIDIPGVGDNPHQAWRRITDPKYAELEGLSMHHSVMGYTNDPDSRFPKGHPSEGARMQSLDYGSAPGYFRDDVIPGYERIGGYEALESGVAQLYSLRRKGPEGEVGRPVLTAEVLDPSQLRLSQAVLDQELPPGSPGSPGLGLDDIRNDPPLVIQVQAPSDGTPKPRDIETIFDLFEEIGAPPQTIKWNSIFGGRQVADPQTGYDISSGGLMRQMYKDRLIARGRQDILDKGDNLSDTMIEIIVRKDGTATGYAKGGIVTLGNRPPRPYSEGGIVTL